jgi:hypothetical protein
LFQKNLFLKTSINSSQGNAGINGNVNWTDTSGTPMSPANNVALVIYNSAGELVAYTFSANDGTYQFNNLPFGKYTLSAGMSGKNNQTVELILSQDSSVSNIDFELTRKQSMYQALKAGNQKP